MKAHCITVKKCRSGSKKRRTVCNFTARYWLKNENHNVIEMRLPVISQNMIDC